MKIVHVLNNFLPFQTAGTEVYVWALCKSLQKIGHDVEVIIPNFGSSVNETYYFDSITITKFSEDSIVDRDLLMGFKKSEGLKSFINLLLISKPDIVHFHELAGSNGISISHLEEAKKNGMKIVFTFHLAGYTCKTGSLMHLEKNICNGLIDINKCTHCYLQTKSSNSVSKLLYSSSSLAYKLRIDTSKIKNKLGTALGSHFVIERHKIIFDKLVSSSDAIVSLTNWYKKILIENDAPVKKVHHIPQGLPLKSKVDSIQVKCTVPLKIIFVGRISFFKGLHILIDAILQLPKEQISLDIYGQTDGSNYEYTLKKKSEKFSNVKWKGILAQEEMISTMQQYHILCLCSTFSEMSPLVIQEAFAAGIPVLASNVYGNVEQLYPSKAGFLFNFKDVESLKQQLILLIKNPELINIASKNIPPTLSFDDIAYQYYKIYTS